MKSCHSDTEGAESHSSINNDMSFNDDEKDPLVEVSSDKDMLSILCFWNFSSLSHYVVILLDSLR